MNETGGAWSCLIVLIVEISEIRHRVSAMGLGCVKTLFRNERILAKRQCELFPALTKP